MSRWRWNPRCLAHHAAHADVEGELLAGSQVVPGQGDRLAGGVDGGPGRAVVVAPVVAAAGGAAAGDGLFYLVEQGEGGGRVRVAAPQVLQCGQGVRVAAQGPGRGGVGRAPRVEAGGSGPAGGYR